MERVGPSDRPFQDGYLPAGTRHQTVSVKEHVSTSRGVSANHNVSVGLSEVQLHNNKYINVKFQEQRAPREL